MVGYRFVVEVVLKEVVRGISTVVANRVFQEKRRVYNIHKHDPFGAVVVKREQNEEVKEKNDDVVADKDLHKSQDNMSPFDVELGDALALYTKRCRLVMIHGDDAVYSYRDSLFTLASTLKDLEPRSGDRYEEVSKFLQFIEAALLGESCEAENAAIMLYEMLSGQVAA